MATVPKPIASITLQEVMEGLASSPGFQAAFEEHTERAVFAETQVLRGTFILAGPGEFLRVTDSPIRHWMWLSGERLVMADGNAPEVEADREVLRFFQEFALLWRGDLAALEEQYALDFEFGYTVSWPVVWKLELTPRSEAVRAAIDRIFMIGESDEQGIRVTGLDLREAGGDWIRFRLRGPQAPRNEASADLEEIFNARKLP